MKKQNRPIELLAPGGDADAVKAAIIAGADAVYCGLPRFNARQRAGNLTSDQLAILVQIAHQHSCRIYLTLNTLIVEEDIDAVMRMIADLSRCGVDAVIVQDLGVLYLLKEYFPDVELHASTQMTTHNCGQTVFLKRFGVKQVNFSRELSLEELRETAACAAAIGMCTEVFIHGAYCISFSGQCYMSSAMSGRSGNRGACVQPCRRSYRCAGKSGELTPFNLKDNSAFARVRELAGAGIGSLKIEGRIKSYKYVYATVAAWRCQLDRYFRGEDVADDDPALHSVFNRSLSSGYLDGKIDRKMFIDSSRDQSLVRVAAIRSYSADTGVLKLDRAVRIDEEVPVLIYAPGFTFVCTGFMGEQCGRFEYRFKITHKLKGKIKSGDELYRQGDYDGPTDLRDRIASLRVEKRKVRVRISGSIGTPLTAVFSTGGREVTVSSETALAKAAKNPLTAAVIADKLGMLGGTEFEFDGLDSEGLEPGLFLPLSALNDLRRRAVAQLTGGIVHETAAPVVSLPARGVLPVPEIRERLAVLVDNEDDIATARLAQAMVLFELPVNAGSRIDHFSQLFTRYPDLVPWFPSILIGGHYTSALKLLRMLQPRMVVTDNSGIGGEAGDLTIPWVSGPLLNVTNSYAVEALYRYGKCSGVVVSHELSRDQMMAVGAPLECSRWYVVYTPLLLMNTRQCIVRNCTGCGTEKVTESCIASCEKSVTLTDGSRQPFFVVKRRGFYNQVYNGRAYFNPAVLDDAPRGTTVFLVDIRGIPSQSKLNCSKRDFVAGVADGIKRRGDGRNIGSSVKPLVQTTTAGQYSRGI